MQVQLAEQIRTFRREKHLTQEQLAEVLGVTVGTVSKWEGGSSTPDLSLIMELADFFGTSVDVLLGYRQQSASLASTLARLRALCSGKQYDEGRREAEKAVKQFPNSFDVIYQSAALMQMIGMEEGDLSAARRAEELYARALELFDQNADPKISRVGIYNSLASIALSLDETDRAVELLKQNNVEGLNNAAIGQALARGGAHRDEALDYLEIALLRLLAQCGAKAVLLAGADGYTAGRPAYADASLHAHTGRGPAFHAAMAEAIRSCGLPVTFVTPSAYEQA